MPGLPGAWQDAGLDCVAVCVSSHMLCLYDMSGDLYGFLKADKLSQHGW